MARLRCEVLEREGALPRIVRDEAGRVLRLHRDAPPAGADWLGHIGGIGVWATPNEGADTMDALEVVWLDTPALDEVGVVVGPDRGDALGLFDSPTSAATGEHTEGAPSGFDRAGEQRRTSVLAWIAAEEGHALAPPQGDEPVQGPPCQPLKRLVADEPLDPLPALEGVPRPRPTALASAPRRELAPEREDTATQIEGLEGMLDRRYEADATSPDGAPPLDTLPRRDSLAGARAPDARDSDGGPPDATLSGATAPRLALLFALAAAVIAWALQAAG
ncbi:MAG: hypothetical protein Q8P18_19075 [Pseudomonadota bacterium]|nr:hypothetical protein [Pseudomonadota bacterium]